MFLKPIPLNFIHLIAQTASPGPVVPVPTLGSWIEEDLGPVTYCFSIDFPENYTDV